ncbi:hypothetical protein MY4038_006636 [Beauveria bassiana]
MPPKRQPRRAASPAGADIRKYFLPSSTRAVPYILSVPSVPSVPSVASVPSVSPSVPSVQDSAPPQKVESDDETRIVKRERIVIVIDDDDVSESQLVKPVQDSATLHKVEHDETRAVKRQRSVKDIDDGLDSQLMTVQSAAELSEDCQFSFESLADFEEFASNEAYQSRKRGNISNVEHVNRTLPNIRLKRIVAASVPETESSSCNAPLATAHDFFGTMHSDPNLSYNLADAEKICGKLTDALNRWPDVDQISYLKRGKTVRQGTNALFDSAVAVVCPEAPVKAQAPYAKLRQPGNWVVCCYVCLIDPYTYVGNRVCIEVPDVTGDVPDARNLILNFVGSSEYEGKGDDGTFRAELSDFKTGLK